MRRAIEFTVGLCVLLLTGMLLTDATDAAGPPTICTANLTIFTTSTGTVTTTAQVTHFRDSGVEGVYTSGFLSGYTLTGAQDIMINNVTHKSQLQGSYVATGPGGTLTIRYTGHTDLTTGEATSIFTTVGGAVC